MNKRYQVFVSSTYVDLTAERQEVMQALLELDCMPAGMELFPATNDDQWSLIKKVIDDCDYYLVIVGGRYGSTSEQTGLSYTQMEYEYALAQEKPVIGFVHKDPSAIASGKSEQSEDGKQKLAEFRDLVQRKVCKFWTTPAELGSVVSRSLVKLIRDCPAVGWVKADLVPDEGASNEIVRLRNRIDELTAILESASTQAPEGTDELAQGDTSVALKYQIRYYENFSQHVIGRDFEVTWDEIFRILSPHMINDASEHRLAKALNDFILDSDSKAIRALVPKGARLGECTLSDEDFQTIKVQLRALGLITKSPKARSVKDTSAYWTLTPYGDNVMTRLRAIRN